MPYLPLAAAPGFSFADPYAIGLLLLGLVVFIAVGALSHEGERAFSATIIYLGLGVAAAAALAVLGLPGLDPVRDAKLIERVAELALVVAVFSAGLKIEEQLRSRGWRSVALLLGVAMPLTIALVALFGTQVMGLSLGAAILLGALLAPTDPVLAGDVGLGPPGEEEKEEEARFVLTAEAGINDGLAAPFVLLGLFVAGQGGTGWLPDWAVADVLYAVPVGVGIGAATGYAVAALALRLRERRLLLPDLDGWLAIATMLLVYGLSEVAGGYGLLAAFAGGLAFRRYEAGHEYNRRVHAGAEVVEKFSELAVILIFGSLITLAVLREPGVAGWLLVPVLILVIRPLTALGVLPRSGMPLRERAFVAWFGVRGVAAIYYAVLVLEANVLSPGEALTLFWTVAACVLVSIVVHGVSTTPLKRRLLR